jgi:PPOX class probable F420-dependent enzyme
MGAESPLLYLDQNYLSGIAKRKPAFRELEPVLRAAVAAHAVAVVESEVHERESAPRPDLGLLELLRGLSGGRRLPSGTAESREVRRRLRARMARDLPDRRAGPGDDADLDALAAALPHCELVTCDAFMADVVRRARLDLRHGTELFTGRRADVERLARRVQELPPPLARLPAWARELLDTAPVGHLGLLDGDGRPRVMPVTFAVVGHELWSAVDEKPKRRPGGELARVRWLRSRPDSALTVDRYDDDWDRLAWVQVLGETTVVDADTDAGHAALAALAARVPQYRAQPPRGPFLRLVPRRALWWRASDG